MKIQFIPILGEASIEKNGQWSWPRDKIAELILELRKNGAGVIVMSVSFSEPDILAKTLSLLVCYKTMVL